MTKQYLSNDYKLQPMIEFTRNSFYKIKCLKNTKPNYYILTDHCKRSPHYWQISNHETSRIVRIFTFLFKHSNIVNLIISYKNIRPLTLYDTDLITNSTLKILYKLFTILWRSTR